MKPLIESLMVCIVTVLAAALIVFGEPASAELSIAKVATDIVAFDE